MPGGAYSSVTFCVPSAIAEARLSTVVEPDTATAVTAGPSAVAMRTVNPPAPVGTAASSSASDQVTVTVGPALAAASAVGSTPSTLCAGLGNEPWLRITASACATATMELPDGASSPFAFTARPSVSRSPAATVYSKRSTALPEPET